MSAEQLVSRVISSEALVDSYALRTGELKPEEWDHIAQAASSLSGCDILIDDTPGVTVTAMKAKLRRVNNLGLVIIDYLQLMQSDRRIDNRTQEVSEISRALKLLAKELNVPVICCSQLSRGTEGRTNKRPMPSDLRESGSIEQDADVIIFLYRDEFYQNAEGGDTVAPDTEQNVAEIIVAKNRHGSTETVKVGWTGRYTKFRDIVLEENLPQ
jgi:replicative DNA helicase